MTEAAHASPHRARVSFAALMFGMTAAPIFWLGQLILGYSISAVACYGSDHPTTIASGAALRLSFYAFDAVAIAAALAGGIVAFSCWHAVKAEKEGNQHRAIDAGEGRARFMALWGLLSSLCFLVGIVFATIGSIEAPLCIR
jgi:hypothetical protein